MGMTRQAISTYRVSTSAALSAVLDTQLYGRTNVELWVKSSGLATFEISGSADGENYRKTGEILIPGGGGESHDGFLNAYRYIKVATTAVEDNEIEIVASGG